MKLWALFLCFVLLFCGAVQASPVQIEAENSGVFDIKSQLFVFTGGVRMVVDDVEIRGDYLRWDVSTQELLMEGNVLYIQGEQELTGDSLVFNVDTSRGEFTSVRAGFEWDIAEEPILVFGDSLAIDGENFTLEAGKITTCDLEEIHYHVAAKRVEVYPGDKMIIRGVTYYDGKIPLFYWPYLTIPLRDGVDQSMFSLPRIGYSAQEGWYVKNSFNYYLSEAAYGEILVDYYTLLGFGKGVRHNYSTKSLGEGVVSLYSIDHAEHGVFRATLDHELEKGPWRLATDNYFEQRPDGENQVKEEIDSRIGLDYSGAKVSASAEGLYRENTGNKTGEYWSVSGDYKQEITDDLGLRLDGGVIYQDYGNPTKMVNYLAESTYTQRNHTLKMAVQQRYNPDLLEEGQQANWSSVNRAPEVSWQVRNPVIGGNAAPLRLQVGLGQFTEYPSAAESWRFNPSVELLSRSWRPTTATTLTYNASWNGYWYDHDLAQSSLYGRVNAQQRLSQAWRLSLGYSRRMVAGETPFRFDRQQELNTLSGQLTYSTQPLYFTVRTGYDFANERYNTVIAQTRIRPNTKFDISLYANYNLNTQTPGNLVSLVKYKDDSGEVQIGGRYRIQESRWERIDGKLTVKLDDTWGISYDAIYNPMTDQFTTGKLGISKDLHCRKISVGYDHVRGEISFEYSINAFPSMPLKVGGSESDSLFDLSSILDILGISE